MKAYKLLLVIFILIVTLQHKENQAAQENNTAKTHQQSTKNLVRTLPVVPATQTTHNSTTTDTNQEKDSEKSDWWIVKLTAVLAGVAFLQFLALIIQSIVMGIQAKRLRESVITAKETTNDLKHSIDEAKRSADAMQAIAGSMIESGERMKKVFDRQEMFGKMQLRAYVSVTLVGEIPQDKQTGWKHTIRMNMTNLGNTPAQEVKFAIRIDIIEFPLPQGFDLSLSPQQTVGDQLDPRQTKFIDASLDELISDELIATIKQKLSPKLYVWGTIYYKDIFGEPHETNFCQFRMWDIKDALSIRSAGRNNNGT